MFLFILKVDLTMSRTFTLTGNTSNLRSYYSPPIELGDVEYECCLIDFQTYNSIPNVDNDNNLFHIGDSVIKIPVGSYELQDIADYLEAEYKTRHTGKSINIKANNNTLQIEIESSHDSIFFNKDKSISKLFGFTEKILEPGIKHISNLPVNILKVNVIQIHCNIVAGSFMNNSPAHILHEFALDVPPGYKLAERPLNLIYLPVNVKEISCIEVQILDQEGRLINFRGEEITLRIHIKSRK